MESFLPILTLFAGIAAGAAGVYVWLSRRLAQLESQNEYLDKRLVDQSQMAEQAKLHFENLANRIFEEKTAKFKKESEDGISQILTPLRERMQEFQKKVDESFGTQAKEQFSLKEQIERIVLANEKITTQAENLTNALKGSSKIQGDWGEIILDTLLANSGLRKDVDYILQGSNLGLKSAEGGHLKPDVIVKLPDSKHIIIDSKVSLTHYERFFSETDDAARVQHMRQFLGSLRSHVDDLSSKGYQDNEKLGTPDFVFMFIPVEGAYALAMQQDEQLHSYAWQKRIVMVCASTLFATLRTVASIWRIEQQNKNTLEIARQGGELYDDVVRFAVEMDKLGKELGQANAAFDGAMKKLSTGRGNILARSEKLKQLGVKTTKTLPAGFFVEEGDALEDLRVDDNNNQAA